jgi:signal transduction histidine kinase/BarA-like signal transduction histidine kinase
MVSVLAVLDSTADIRFNRRSVRFFGTDSSEANVRAARRRSLPTPWGAGGSERDTLAELVRRSCLFAFRDLSQVAGFPDLDAVLWAGSSELPAPQRERVFEQFARGIAPGGLLQLGTSASDHVPPELFTPSGHGRGLFVRCGDRAPAARPVHVSSPHWEMSRSSPRFSSPPDHRSALPSSRGAEARVDGGGAEATALDGLGCAIAHFHEDLTLLYENDTYRRWFGSPHADETSPISGRAAMRGLVDECRLAVLGGKPVLREMSLSTGSDGTARELEIRLLPHTSPSGTPGIAALIFDVAGHARASRARAKLRFLANVSHEVRTPLNAVVGFAEQGAQTATSDEDRHTYARVLAAGRHALRIVGDVLDFAQLEVGKLRLVHAPFELAEVVQQALSFVRRGADEKGLTLALEEEPDVPRVLVSDAGRLTQILTNLLANAVKFTEAGEVRLRIAEHDGRVSLSVTDTGVGISPEDHAQLFQPFEQGRPRGHRRRPQGTGLGLAISRQLAELLGGSLTLEGAAAGGTVATLCVPYQAVPRASWPGTPGLIVAWPADDPELGALARGLQTRGVRVLLAAQVHELPSDATWVIPAHELADAADALNARALAAAPSRVVVVGRRSVGSPTASALTSLEPLTLRSPVSPLLLLEALERSSAHSPTRRVLLTGMRLLVVDDNPTNRVLMTTVLAERGADVVCVPSGEQALEDHGDCRSFDAVLCDIELDDMDGFEFCERLQKTGTSTPVLAVTAHSSLYTAERAQQVGMRAVLTKPIAADELVGALLRLVTQPR